MNNLSIKFDYASFTRDIIEVGNATATMYANQISQELGSPSNDYHYEIDTMDSNKILLKVGSSNWNAFLEQFGKGSEMSMENPFLSEYYLNSNKGWNIYRTSATITSRPNFSTTMPDWENGYGYTEYTSRAKGFNDNVEVLGGRYAPYKGTLQILEIFRNKKMFYLDMLKNQFNNLYGKSCSLGNYVKGGN